MKKQLSKLISLSLAAVMLFTGVTFARAAGGSETGTVAGQYEKVSDILRVVGILDEENDRTLPDESITRAEFAAYIGRILGVDPDSRTSQIFSDVPAEHWAAAYINGVVSSGIMSGYSQGQFAPDDYISYEQAAKVMSGILGYDVEAQYNGGYPAGYLKTALDLDLFRGTGYGAEFYVTKASALQMLYNALDVDVMRVVQLGSEDRYAAVEGENLLYVYFDIEKNDGIVQITETNNILGDSVRAGEDRVVISGETYLTGDTSISGYLGYNVTYYAKINHANDERTLIYFEENSKNSVKVVKAEDISAQTTADEVVYYDGDRIRSTKIPQNAVVLFNGQELTEMEREHLMPASGEIRFIDNTSNGAPDVIMVYSYHNYVVNNVNLDEKVVYDKYGKAPLRLDSSVEYSLRFRGEEITLEELTEWDVLAVAPDKEKVVNGEKVIDTANAQRYEIEVINESVSGTIGQQRDEELVIDGQTYEISSTYLQEKNSQSPSDNLVTFQPGLTGVFYLDYDGKVIAADTTVTDDLQYGFMVAFAQDGAFEEDTAFKIFSEDGTPWFCLSSGHGNSRTLCQPRAGRAGGRIALLHP